MGKAILIMFGIMQGVAILLGMINAGDWNIGHWDAQTRSAVSTIPVTNIAVLTLMYLSGESEKKGKGK